MSGGIFSSMNKVRPGAYINFETNVEETIEIGERGIATMATNLSWGEDNKLIELNANDLINGASLSKIGLMSTDAKALLFNLALQNANTLKIYKLNTGGEKATATLDEGLVVTAKYGGTFGNKIAILIKAAGDKFNVETYVDGYFMDSQKVSGIEELQSNDFVDFSGTGTLAVTSSLLLTGGTDGTQTNELEAYKKYFELLKITKWHTMAVPSSTETVIAAVIDFIKTMRTEEGKYVQAVVANAEDADYEGIINNVNGVILNDTTTVTAVDFTAWVAGATAGAMMTDSNTGKIITDATGIVGLLSNEAIINGLQEGKFILSLTQNGEVKVEKDINSLHTFTPEKSYIFSKNRVIRELDEIGSEIENIWETTYLGKVSNTEQGRTMFKSSIIAYLTELQNNGAIQEFDSSTVDVQLGNDIDSVIAAIAVKPIDSMEFLYMTVNVEQ